MKSVALFAVLTAFLIIPRGAMAQGFRGATIGTARSAGPAHFSSNSSTPTHNGTASSVTITTTPTAAAQRTPTTSVNGVPAVTIQRFAPPVLHSGVAVISPSAVRHPPVLVIETARPTHLPFRPHRPAVLHHHYPGIVIIDTPYYSSTTVVTELAPGVVREERRYAEPPPAESRTRGPGQLAPFDPTPQEVVDRMLRLAAVKPGDLLYDLGAGDGRVAIAAAKKYGVKAVGFEIDPGLVKLARENVRKQGVEKLVEIRQQDFLTADLSLPSVVTLYLSYDGNLTVRPRLMSQLKTGARVVSYTFDMAEWQPKATESYRDSAGNSHMIYLWEIGGPLAFGDVGRSQ